MYETICKHPNNGIAVLSSMLLWKKKKTSKYLKKLTKDGLVLKAIDHEVELFCPTPWQDMINWDEIDENSFLRKGLKK